MPVLDNPLFVSFLMLVWGLLVRYAPFMQSWPNRMLPWMNLAIGVLAKLIAPETAHASVFSDLGHSLGWLIVPVEQILARQVFETFIKPTLEHFGIVGYPAAPVEKAKKRGH